MHSSLIGKVEKANRYARELDRITVDRLSLTFRGDNDTHHVALDAGQWRCTCHYFESWGSCVHLLTLQKVMGVMLPEEAQVSIFSAGQPVPTLIPRSGRPGAPFPKLPLAKPGHRGGCRPGDGRLEDAAPAVRPVVDVVA